MLQSRGLNQKQKMSITIEDFFHGKTTEPKPYALPEGLIDVTTLPEYEQYIQGDAISELDRPPEDHTDSFVLSALEGSIKNIGLARSIQIARDHLQQLYAIQTTDREEKHGLSNKIASLGTHISEALDGVKIGPDTVSLYIDTVKFLYTDQAAYSCDRSMINKKLATNHASVKASSNEQALESYNTLLSDPNFYTKLDNFFEKRTTDSKGRIVETQIDVYNYPDNEAFLADILSGIGIDDVEAFITVCAHKSSEEHERVDTSSNFRRIADIESRRPGAVKLLHQFYGICGFGRYNTDALTQQFDNHGKKNKPYGIAYSSYSDHNDSTGISSRDRYKKDIRPLLEGLGDDYYLRITESGDTLGLGKILLRLDALYGTDHPISFALIRPHGWDEGTEINPDAEVEKVGNITVDSRIGKRTARIFVPNPLLIFESCSTGKEQGFAQKVSRDLNATAIAPPEDVNTEALIVTISNGKLKIEPHFTNTADPRKGERLVTFTPVLYKNGEKITGKDYDDYFAELNEHLAHLPEEREPDFEKLNALFGSFK